MKTSFIINGDIKLVLIPENEMEREWLNKVSLGSIEKIADGHSLLGQNLNGGLIIKEANKKP